MSDIFMFLLFAIPIVLLSAHLLRYLDGSDYQSEDTDDA